jgi:Flp pilus assembly protein TadG
MPQSSPRIQTTIKRRFGEAMGTIASADGVSASNRGQDPAGRSAPEERGSAVVEFTFLALLLMVPLIYFIITVGQIQGGSFAVVGAADQAAKVYVAQADAETGRTAAEQAVMVALADYGHPADNARMETNCDPSDCFAPGSAVTVTVHLTVPLPFVPFSDSFRLNASQLDASATQVVGRFR